MNVDDYFVVVVVSQYSLCLEYYVHDYEKCLYDVCCLGVSEVRVVMVACM